MMFYRLIVFTEAVTEAAAHSGGSLLDGGSSTGSGDFSGINFLRNMKLFSDWLFDLMVQIWDCITGNWVLLLSFCLVVVSIVVAVFRRIRNISK